MQNKFLRGKVRLIRALDEYQDILYKLVESGSLDPNNHSFLEESLKSIDVIRNYDVNFNELLEPMDDEKMQVMEMIEFVKKSGMIKQCQRDIKIDKILK